MNDIPANKTAKKGFPKKKSLPAGVHHRAYRFPIFPTEEQKVLLAKIFGSTRFVWNTLLADSKAEYKQTGKHRINTPAKYKTEFPWLSEADSLALANAQLNLKKAYSAFFDKENPAGPPSFKKKTHRQSYTTNNQINDKAPNGSISLVGDQKQRALKLPKLGWISIRVHRELGGVIKSATITKEPSGEYFVSLLCEVKIDALPSTGSVVGIDLGLTDFLTLSDGSKKSNPKPFSKVQKKLAREQRKLSKQKNRLKRQNKRLSESKNYQKQRIKVAKLHKTIANQRADFIHKASFEIIKNHDVLVIEDLAVKNMMKNRKLAKAIGDSSWSKFRDQLMYKAKYYGKQIVVIDRWYPSSQICSCCGVRSGKKDLNIRKWECFSCGSQLDRDTNAAINIKKEGIRLISEIPKAA